MTHFVIIKGRNGKEALCKWVGHSLKVKIGQSWLPITWRDFGGEGHVLAEWQGD
jgi:hypothetical protein